MSKQYWIAAALIVLLPARSQGAPPQDAVHPIILHAARLLEIDTGRMLTPERF